MLLENFKGITGLRCSAVKICDADTLLALVPHLKRPRMAKSSRSAVVVGREGVNWSWEDLLELGGSNGGLVDGMPNWDSSSPGSC